MKIKRINQDIYNYSKTLYGAERLKLMLQAIYDLGKKGDRYELDDIPDICATFDNKHEYQDYLTLHTNHLIINMVIVPMIGEIHNFCFASIFLIKYINLKEEDIDVNLVKGLYRKVQEFFAILKFVEDLSKKYGIELFTYHNRGIVDRYIELMERLKEFCLAVFKLEVEEMSDKQDADETFDYVEKIFNIFQAIAEK